MMRSLFSGVSGLKTHQTRMDVIGNNIANVNTTAYKSKSINFSDMLYQTTQSATAPNATNNTAGTNPRQIGLGVKTGAINTSITTEGASQSTGNPFDIKLTGEAFFVVTDGTNQYFTRDGSFDVDSAGNLCMASTGYIVEGWTSTDSETGAIIQDSVKPIKVLSASNETYPASYTTAATISGIVDMYDEQLETEYGKLMNIQVLDDRGYEYNLKFGIKSEPGTSTKTVLNSEYNYSLPATLTKKTGTEISSYNVYDSIGTTDTGIALEDNNSTFMNSVKAVANTLKGTDTNIKTDTATNQKYVEVKAVSSGKATQNATDEVVVTDGSIYTDKVIRVYLEDTTSYTYTDSSGNAAELDINDKALAALYTVDTTDTLGNTYNRISGGGIKVIKKQYTDGGEDQTDYEIYLTNADNTVSGGKLTGLSYSDLVSFIPTDQAVSSTYTTTETMETGSKAGSYVLTLVGMTDSDGEEVTGWDGLDVAKNGVKLIYDTGDGSFISVDGGDAFTVALSTIGTGNFSNVSFDMTNTSNVNNGGKSTVAGIRDDGYKVGQLTGVSVGQDGTITANYDNGMQKSIAQIAVATFANSMGLENVGDNLYQQTSNSGEFDGVGIDIKGSGTGYMTTGVLEMSNVDLASEFTDMITTQRGFQANSRIITVSDTLLEELVNLKR